MPRLHRDVMKRLVTDIVSGAKKPGELLPREVDLAVQFGVSRGVARETVRALEERGLVSVKHGRGATVCDGGSWDVFDPDVLSAMLDGPQRKEILAHYLACRRILEVEAAGLAAEHATANDLQRLAEALAAMQASVAQPRSSTSEEAFHEADIAFHQAVAQASGNRALAALVERIHSALLLARYPLARPQYRRQRALPEHERILAALQNHDVEAARQGMRDHLETVASYLNASSRPARHISA